MIEIKPLIIDNNLYFRPPNVDLLNSLICKDSQSYCSMEPPVRDNKVVDHLA